MMTLEQLLPLIRNNLACYLDKPLTKDLIDSLMQQIIDSIDYSLDAKEEN
jgi:hypothetical protein